jgi:hypothetical protein
MDLFGDREKKVTKENVRLTHDTNEFMIYIGMCTSIRPEEIQTPVFMCLFTYLLAYIHISIYVGSNRSGGINVTVLSIDI